MVVIFLLPASTKYVLREENVIAAYLGTEEVVA